MIQNVKEVRMSFSKSVASRTTVTMYKEKDKGNSKHEFLSWVGLFTMQHFTLFGQSQRQQIQSSLPSTTG